MSVSFKDFLQSAEVLLSNPESKEIDFRNLISRSYYALFILSREKAEFLPIPISEDKYARLGSHEKIFVKFAKHPDKKIKQLADTMYKRKEARRKADYDNHENIVRSEAAEHLFAIKALITKLEQLNPN